MEFCGTAQFLLELIVDIKLHCSLLHQSCPAINTCLELRHSKIFTHGCLQVLFVISLLFANSPPPQERLCQSIIQ